MNPSLHNVADLERIDALADDLATAVRRNKELEAELLSSQQTLDGTVDMLAQEKARAEKAEAELAKVRQHFTVCPEHEFILRAEKAEAEVERLMQYCSEHHRNKVPRNLFDAHPPRVNPSGESLSARKATPKTDAHRLCWDEPCSECEAEEAAARKEREDG